MSVQFCKQHFDNLSTAIGDRGMSHLVRQTRDAAMDAVINRITAGRTSDNFDPLIEAQLAIASAYLHCIGTGAVITDKQCPLCAAEEHVPGLAEDWVQGACDDELEHARTLGLVPGLQ